MIRPHTTLFAAADELPSGNGTPPVAAAPTVTEAIQAIEDKALPMGQRLTVAANALRGIDPTNQLATLKSQLDQAKADLSARDEEITKLKAANADLEKQVAAREADVTAADEARVKAEKTAADLQAKEQDLDKRAEAKAKEHLGALGMKSTDLPAQDPKQGEQDDKASAEEQIRELSGSRRTEAAIFFKQHGKLPDWFAAEHEKAMQLKAKNAAKN